MNLSAQSVTPVFDRLFGAYGPQYWWPADTPFEVMVGAVLTQNTAWSNVERAIGNLMRAGLDTPEAVLRVDASSLSALLRPAGYFNVKARRLQSLCEWLRDTGGVDALSRVSTVELRSRLLAIHGVGRETADDILLYALRRPVFVIDAYTRRTSPASA